MRYLVFLFFNLKPHNMKTILNLALLGFLSGMIACFWSRIIRPNMIFRGTGKWLTRMNNRYLIEQATDSIWIKLLKCAFCISPWLVFIFSLWYACYYQPPVLPFIIGVIGALGAGNFVIELVNVFRSEET
jgi:hypothetical protein